MVTKKDSKKRLTSKELNSLSLQFFVIGLITFIGSIIFELSTLAGNRGNISGILLIIAFIFIFFAILFNFDKKIVRQEEKVKRRIKRVKAMISKDEFRKIYPRVNNYEEKYNLARILRQVQRNEECDIVIKAILMDDESIWITLEVNGSLIEEYRYTDYELFLSTWEVR